MKTDAALAGSRSDRGMLGRHKPCGAIPVATGQLLVEPRDRAGSVNSPADSRRLLIALCGGAGSVDFRGGEPMPRR